MCANGRSERPAPIRASMRTPGGPRPRGRSLTDGTATPGCACATTNPARAHERERRGPAARLEHRLHGPEIDDRGLVAWCAFAADAALAAVLCRPEHIPLAANQLTGSAVDVVTALGFHDPSSPLRQPPDLAREANKLIGKGASEVALIAAPGTWWTPASTCWWISSPPWPRPSTATPARSGCC